METQCRAPPERTRMRSARRGTADYGLPSVRMHRHFHGPVLLADDADRFPLSRLVLGGAGSGNSTRRALLCRCLELLHFRFGQEQTEADARLILRDLKLAESLY